MGGAWDCEVFCDDRAPALGVVSCCSEASACSWSLAASVSASGSEASLMGTWEARWDRRRGVPLTELRFDRRDVGDDMVDVEMVELQQSLWLSSNQC